MTSVFLRRIAVLALVGTALTACQIRNQDAGMVMGGIGGGVIGSMFGSGKGQILATGAGVVAGALIGKEIGRLLDEADRQRMRKAEEDALNDANAQGKRVTWANPESGAKGEAVASPPEQVPVQAGKDGVQPIPVSGPPKLILKPGSYTTKGASGVNVRSGPTTASQVVGQVKPGETVDSVGETATGEKWTLVARNGMTIGYISSSLLQQAEAGAGNTAPAAQPAVVSAPPSATSAAQTGAPVPFKLIEAPTVQAPAPVATIENAPAAGQASMATCRTVKRSVEKGSESATEEVRYCRTAEGWQPVRA